MSDVVIYVTQTKEQAHDLRRCITLPNVIVTYYGANILGFNYRGKRPSTAICAYEEREDSAWTKVVLLAGLAPGAKVIT